MMSYQNDFVVSIIHNGKPVREFNSSGKRTATIPFGSEYKIRLKNKKIVRAKAEVFIDGMPVLTNGGRFVLHPGQTLDLERFVDDLTSGNKFKFISLQEGMKTGEIQDPTSQENGRIEVKFYPESVSSVYERVLEGISHSRHPYPSNRIIINNNTDGSTTYNVDGNRWNFTTTDDIKFDASGLSTTNSVKKGVKDTKGATVEGSNSSQSFSTTEDFPTGGCTTISLQLQGPKSSAEPREAQPVWQVVMLSGQPVAVKMNGVEFTSIHHGANISITNEGLCINGKGINIKTKEFSIC